MRNLNNWSLLEGYTGQELKRHWEPREIWALAVISSITDHMISCFYGYGFYVAL